jgi:DNA-binding YbaB/EbfC family protein
MSNNMQDMMRQAQVLQKKMEEVQKKLDVTEITGFAAGGNISLTLSGKMNGRDVRITENALQDCGLSKEAIASMNVSVLEDLILAALNDARTKVEAHVQQEMQSATGGMNIPGLMG